MTRQEHLDWCKKRALEHIDNGDLKDAFISICTDLGKHEETKDHPAIITGMRLMLFELLNTQHDMRKFIEDIN